MKYAIMVLRSDGSHDFYSSLQYLHEQENIDVSYRWFVSKLKENGIYENDSVKVYRKRIVREG